MKHFILAEVVRKALSTPSKKRAIKRLVLSGALVLIAVCAVGAWAAWSAIGYVSQVAQSQETQASISHFQGEVKDTVDGIRGGNCWSVASDLLRIQPWIEKPLGQHFESLKSACLGVGSERREEV